MTLHVMGIVMTTSHCYTKVFEDLFPRLQIVWTEYLVMSRAVTWVNRIEHDIDKVNISFPSPSHREAIGP